MPWSGKLFCPAHHVTLPGCGGMGFRECVGQLGPQVPPYLKVGVCHKAVRLAFKCIWLIGWVLHGRLTRLCMGGVSKNTWAGPFGQEGPWWELSESEAPGPKHLFSVC